MASRNDKIRGTMKMEEVSVKMQGEIRVVQSCEEERGRLCAIE